MLSHRSGLPGAAGDLLEDLGYDQSHVLNRLRLDPLTPIRTKYDYSNFGFTAGAIAASNAMGQPWADFADANLFGPLGMTPVQLPALGLPQAGATTPPCTSAWTG